ncbi:hypothetical protein [Nocardia sp. NPDC052566]|uniref:hypothetical protein n=1 Tax=Nocardia sp. NPDC052566 TaxID=3364330 RepID=UPI0037C977F9
MVLIPGSFDGAWVDDDVAAPPASDEDPVHPPTSSGLDDEPNDRRATTDPNPAHDLVDRARSHGEMARRGVRDAIARHRGVAICRDRARAEFTRQWRENPFTEISATVFADPARIITGDYPSRLGGAMHKTMVGWY